MTQENLKFNPHLLFLFHLLKSNYNVLLVFRHLIKYYVFPFVSYAFLYLNVVFSLVKYTYNHIVYRIQILLNFLFALYIFIPYKKYTTLKDETNNVVDDLHTSEIGHKELFNDLIKNIKL